MVKSICLAQLPKALSLVGLFLSSRGCFVQVFFAFSLSGPVSVTS